LKSPGGARRRRDSGSRPGGEQNGEHRHGLGHGDQGRVSYGDLREHKGLGEGKIQFFARAPRELEPPRAAGAVESSSGSDMSWRPAPGRSTLALLRVTGKTWRPWPVRLRGLPDQTCSKSSSGFSDTLGVPVRPVGGCGCCVLRGERYMGVDCMYGCSVNSVALCSVNHCSREEPALHSPTVPWVCDARYTVACLGRPYL